MRDSLPRPARISAIEVESVLCRTLVLDTSFEADPGQFVMLWLPRLDEKPFSLVDSDPLTITIATVGPFTQAVHSLQIGDRLWWRGPLGRGFRLHGQRVLLAGGGYGVAPLAFLGHRARADDREVLVTVGASTSSELLLLHRFRGLGARVLVATEDGSLGRRGTVTDLVEPFLERREVDAVYACGPEGMLTALEDMARKHSIPTQLSWEAYIRCGLGLCGSCHREGRLVCWDGPVFAV
jgi:dihydroorotate dehydrogenase electron transfer subunit